MDPILRSKAEKWLSPAFDSETRDAVQHLMDHDPAGLEDAFYKDLEFGTGGLRGVMGAGSNRINRYTIGMATQGLANYLRASFGPGHHKVAIAHDSRINSPFFARTTAEVFSANGFEVYLFDGLRPTPELSFTLRHLGCKAGVVITASHNPKEYNGYKVYWEDGGQLVPPHDRNVIEKVRQIQSVEEVKFDANEALIHSIGEVLDKAYLDRVVGLSFRQGKSNLKIVYTSLHGTGIQSIPEALQRMGFESVSIVEAQATPDGNFPTVASPNPEENSAMEMALDQAKAEGADIVLGTDPDSDRVGIGVRNPEGELVLLNGNQAGSLLVDYLLQQWKANNRLKGKEFVAKTVVTSDLISRIAASYQVPCPETLTGFKYIAELIQKEEGKRAFIGGGEESYGYLAGDFVRDKDAVISSVMLCEAAAHAAEKNSSLFERLLELYQTHGYYQEKLVSFTKKGKTGAEAIAQLMERFRNTPPTTLGGSAVVAIRDFKSSTEMNTTTGTNSPISLPGSNVMQFITADGSKITARPSGTEPKIKFYFSVVGKLETKKEFPQEQARLLSRIDSIIEELELG
ncbi:MAG: phospho-sugar mutase [Salibacteraceae bacterium]